MKRYCVILASGVGSRFGADIPKQFIQIAGKMVVEHTLSACDCGLFDELILVVSAPYLDAMRLLVDRNRYSIAVHVVEGGDTRRSSCEKGIMDIPDDDAFVVVHNAAQPLVKKETLCKCLEVLKRFPAAVSAIPCAYTIMHVNGGSVLTDVPDRSKLFCDMGVEGFRLKTLRKVFASADKSTNVANLVGLVMASRLGDVCVYEGDAGNIKLTYKEDLVFAEKKLMEKVLR